MLCYCYQHLCVVFSDIYGACIFSVLGDIDLPLWSTLLVERSAVAQKSK